MELNTQSLSQESIRSPARPIVWSIAGSDSGGGAGIQADNATIYDLGGHPCNVVTGITAQNSQKVGAVSAIPDDILLEQLTSLFNDMPPAAIKIGALFTGKQVQILTSWLRQHIPILEQKTGQSIPIVWDPVMIASTGQALNERGKAPSAKDYLALAKCVSLITPNIDELQVLFDTTLDKIQGEQSNLSYFATLLNTNILLTGGDNQTSVAEDWLATRKLAHTSEKHHNQLIRFSHPRVNTDYNHGTGCTLSSAIATAYTLHYPLLDAICIGKAYVTQGLSNGYQVGQSSGVLARMGWPNSLTDYPKVNLRQAPTLPALSFKQVVTPLNVYAVSQSVTVLEQVLKAGARTVQLRIKSDHAPSEVEKAVQQAVKLGKQYQAQVFINDHWQLAIKHKAFGVHLGQEDMLEADLTSIANAGLALGLSSHGYFEMLFALQLNPSYLAIGHIFPTPTKNMPSQAQGLQKLTRYCQLINHTLPLVAIGGIDSVNMSQVKQTGVADIALVRAVEKGKNPANSWLQLQQLWQNL